MSSYDFAELCAPHYAALVAYANRLLPGRSAEALDLVQEAFLKAYRCWSTWAPRGSEDPARAARGWLHRIVQNVFIDTVRSRDHHRKLLEEHHREVVESTYGLTDDYDVQELGDHIGDEVKDALLMLDVDQRTLIILADFQGEQYNVIAEQLGIPIGTVMSRLHRVRKKLAGFLEDYARDAYGIGSDRPSKAPLTRVAPEPPEPEPDGIDGVMAGDDGGDLLRL